MEKTFDIAISFATENEELAETVYHYLNLDADNIVHLVTEDKSLMDAANEYYNNLQENGEELG